MIRPKTQKLKISQSLLNQVSTARFDLSQTSYIGLLTHKSATLWRGDRIKAWLPCRRRAAYSQGTQSQRGQTRQTGQTRQHRTEIRIGMGMDRTRQTHGHMDKDMDG